MPTDIRNLVQDWNPSVNATLREVASTSATEAMYEENQGWSARMPGDEEHPLGSEVQNPMPEIGGPLALSRALRAGEIPFEKERLVRVYLDQFEKQSGQSLYNPRHHQVVDQDPQELRVYGDSTSLRTGRY